MQGVPNGTSLYTEWPVGWGPHVYSGTQSRVR
jgi:hypothetical protein